MRSHIFVILISSVAILSILSLVLLILLLVYGNSLKFNNEHDLIDYSSSSRLLLNYSNYFFPLNNRGTKSPNDAKYPWLVSIRHRKNFSHICFGSLIQSQYVLTAAHCLFLKDPKLLSLTFQESDGVFTRTFNASVVYIHEHFNLKKGYNDIALVKLTHPISRDIGSIIDLPWNQSSRLKLADVVKWESKLMNKLVLIELQIRSIKDQTCSGYVKDLKNISKYFYCAYGQQQNVCLGDSGSPLLVSLKNIYYAFGLVSFVFTKLDLSDGKVKCDISTPSYFTRVAKYLQWIEDILKT